VNVDLTLFFQRGPLCPNSADRGTSKEEDEEGGPLMVGRENTSNHYPPPVFLSEQGSVEQASGPAGIGRKEDSFL